VGTIVYQGRTALQAIVRNITERYRAEEDLRQAEQRYRELFEEAPAMYLICRDEGGVPIVDDCNELFLSTLGYSPDEVVGRSVADFYTPESRELLESGAFQRALAGQFDGEERQLVTKDGRIIETMLRAVPETGPDGRVCGTRAMYVDITERKQAELAARESEARYRLLAENTTDLIWTMNLGLRYTYMSPAVTRMRGYSVEEIIDTTVQETMTPASLEVARKTLAEELALEREGNADPNRSAKLELEMYCKDGSTIWTEMNMTFLRDADGRPTGILGVTRDISERKRSEQALEESERRYRLIAEYATDLIWTTDMSLHYTYVSPSVQRLRGYTVEEAMAHKVEEDLCPPSLQVAMKALAEEMERERAEKKAPYRWRTLELEHYCKDGSTVWLEVNTTFMRDEDGRLVGLLGSSRDISERRRAEAALRTKDSAVASSINGIALADLSGALTYVNPSVLRMWGYDHEEEILGRDISEFWQTREEALEVRRALRGRGKWLGELVAIKKDGSPFCVEMQASMVTDEAGNPSCMLGSFLDITERRAAAVALEESEKRYRLLAENASDIIWAMDMSLQYTYQSPSVARIRGYNPEEAIAQTIEATLTPASLDVARRALAEELTPGKMKEGDFSRLRTLELEHSCKDGSTVWLEVTAAFLRDEKGRPIGLLGASRDISERRAAAEALEESEGRYRLLAENVSDVIFTTDLALRYTYVSPSVTRARGYSVEEVMAGSLADSLAPHSLEQAREVIAEELINERAGKRAPSRTVEVELNRKDGSTIWAEVTATFLRDPDGKPVGLLGVSRDIGERKRAEQERALLHTELEAKAVTDSLTGLYNHAYFYERLADEIDRADRYGHRFALVMMDVDAFKHYNDSCGHQAGDTALRLVGECVRSAMRRSDLAFRYGGDEFVALLLDADVSRAQNVVRRINKRIAARLKELDDPAAGWLGVSAGIACYPADAASPDELVGMADAAMYDAKRLVWARGVMGQQQSEESEGSPVNANHDTQSRILSGAASSLSTALQDLARPDELAQSELRTMATLGAAAEIRDPFIRGHQERTSRLAAMVAKEMGLSSKSVRSLTTAGLLHDLGKVGVGESILNKPGKLSETELAKMKQHPASGASMIVSGSRTLRPLAPIVRHHHERFDGGGYPDGLASENIPLEARILAVADAFDAMTHERAYRKALSTEEALGEIQRGAGTWFDQAVVQAFLGVMRRRNGEPG
jgi:diguanylate cyclase (GGDEF)-like protein/PAS domain S-box-containing protein